MKKSRSQAAAIALIAVNVIVFICAEITGSTEDTTVLVRWGGAYVPLVADGEYWRLFTSMFLHAGIRHLLNNMLLLYVIGYHLEPRMGHVRYLIVYLLGGLIGNIVNYRWEIYTDEMSVSVGASGAIMATVGAMIWVIIKSRGRGAGLTLRQMLIMLFFILYYGFTSPDVANAAHIGGLIGGFLLGMLLYRGHGRRTREW